MDIIERYIYAVTRHLSAQQRDEVAAELRATIEDMATDHAKGKRPGPADRTAAMHELGNPALLALQYNTTNRYLIGPKWYDIYMAVLKRTLLYVPAAVAAVVSLVNVIDKQAIAASIIDGVGAGIMATIQIAFWTTLAFFIAERTMADPKSLIGKAPAWSLDDLPEIPVAKKPRVSVVEGVTNIALLALAMVLWVIGFFGSPLNTTSEPVLNRDMWAPWGIAGLLIIGLGMVHEIMKLKIGRWTTGVAVSNTLLAILFGAFAVITLSSVDILNPGFLTNIGAHMDSSTYQHSKDWIVGILLVTAVGSSIWSIIDGVRKTLRQRHDR